MVTEENFLNSIDDYQKNFYFHPEKMTFREMNVVEEDSESEEDKNDMIRMSSVQGASIKTHLNSEIGGKNNVIDK